VLGLAALATMAFLVVGRALLSMAKRRDSKSLANAGSAMYALAALVFMYAIIAHYVKNGRIYDIAIAVGLVATATLFSAYVIHSRYRRSRAGRARVTPPH